MTGLVKSGKPVVLAQVLTKLEMAYIKDALAEAKGNKTEAAKLLSLNRSTLSEKIKRMGIEL